MAERTGRGDVTAKPSMCATPKPEPGPDKEGANWVAEVWHCAKPGEMNLHGSKNGNKHSSARPETWPLKAHTVECSCTTIL